MQFTLLKTLLSVTRLTWDVRVVSLIMSGITSRIMELSQISVSLMSQEKARYLNARLAANNLRICTSQPNARPAQSLRQSISSKSRSKFINLALWRLVSRSTMISSTTSQESIIMFLVSWQVDTQSRFSAGVKMRMELITGSAVTHGGLSGERKDSLGSRWVNAELTILSGPAFQMFSQLLLLSKHSSFNDIDE